LRESPAAGCWLAAGWLQPVGQTTCLLRPADLETLATCSRQLERAVLTKVARCCGLSRFFIYFYLLLLLLLLLLLPNLAWHT
jgi:hypothetical protein